MFIFGAFFGDEIINSLDELQVVSGCVEEIIFRNDDTGFTVLELDYHGDLLTVVGEMTDVAPGEILKATGVYGTHSTFGPQFKASVIEKQMPANASAILRYLSSGAIKGIGPVTARNLVEQFGDKTLEVMEKSPELLLKIKGFSKSKVEKISGELNRIFGIRSVMAFLAQYGITPAESVQIWKKWGLSVPEVITANPFVLCSYDFGVVFERADKIRASMKLPDASPTRICGAIVYILNKNLSSGHSCLPYGPLCETAAKLLSISTDDVETQLDNAIIEGEFIKEISTDRIYIYLPQLYMAEKYCASRFAMANLNVLSTSIIDQISIDDIEKSSKINYDDVQREAIEKSLTQGALIITGGPGTGKTTVVNGIITVLKSLNLNVCLTAPTGRAAKRMSTVTGCDAKTIHRLLEAGAFDSQKYLFGRNEQNPIFCDVLIVDEFSMVDILLLESLLRATPLNARIILVGDHNQLPSVGPGNILRDLIDSNTVSVIQLTKIFRQAAKSLIVINAHKIISGEEPDLYVKDNDFFFINSPNPVISARTVCDLCDFRLPKTYGFSPVWDIQVICPSKKGDVGTYELNRKLQNQLNPADKSKAEINFMGHVFRQGDKIMQTKNNYDIEVVKSNGETSTGVFNGDIGIIQAIDKTHNHLTIRFDDKTTDYSKEMLNQLELAYAITVHKSQGSEFEAVILPLLGSHKNLYYRNLLYTAVTRARQMLIIIGNKSTIINMINNNKHSKRYSNFKKFLQEEADAFDCSM